MTALRSLGARFDVTWISSAMTAEERGIAASGPLEEAEATGRVRLRLVAHDAEAYRLFYEVVANPVLWFVQHGLWAQKVDPQADLFGPWKHGYAAVNAGFADAVLDELARDPEAAVLFQDYHLYVAPALVRTASPRARLAHFIHIPWVPPGDWSVLQPELARSVHEGLLACDSVGFHTERWRAAFVASCETLLGRGAEAQARSHANPIAVDAAEFDALGRSAAVAAAEQELLRDRPELLILRVDRTDPSKNVIAGFASFGLLLERRPDLRGRVGMLALLDPSRQTIPEYVAYRTALEAEAARVNGAFARAGWTPIDLRIRDDFPSSVAAYRQYDVLLVNPVLDGLNLVAKEAPLVNVRDGVLVLSRNAGAWAELGAWALGVDPADVEETAAALERALELPLGKRKEMLAGLRARVRGHDLFQWANAELTALDEAPVR